MKDERSLGDLAEPVSTDITETPTPESFDLDSFLAGVRPTRRSVQLYPQGQLIARLDQIAEQIRRAPDEENVDELIDEFDRVKAQFRTGVTFVVEKRSGDWVRQFRRDVKAEYKLRVKFKSDKSADMDGPADELARVLIEQLAAQIVIPENVTYDKLRQLDEANEGELSKLLRAMNEVNNVLAEAQDVMTADFSRRRSGNRGTSTT